MKTKFFGLVILTAMLLLSVQCKRKAKEVKVEPSYCAIFIDLNDLMGKVPLQGLNQKLYDSALKGVIKVYKNDSFTSVISKEHFSMRGATEELIQLGDPTDPKGERLIDTVIRNVFRPSEISSNSIAFSFIYDQQKNNFKLEYTGISLNYKIMINGVFIAEVNMCFISKDDLIKVLGQKPTNELFANCYKAMLKSVNADKKVTPDKITSFNIDMLNFIGKDILDEMNSKMYDAVTKGLKPNVPPFAAYKADDLKTIYTAKEILNRGITSEMVQIPLSKESDILIDTIINNIFYPDGQKVYSLSLLWDYDKEKMTATANISAFGMYVPYCDKANVEKKYTIFWLDWKDANAIYSSVEITTLNYAFYKAFGSYRFTYK